MSFAVLAIALVNVAFGLDWRTAPDAPPLAAATQPVVFPEQTPWPTIGDHSPSSNAPVLQSDTANAQAPRAQATEDAAPPGCNVSACEAAYRSFRASDCTYQPFDGPRRLCRKR